MARFQREAELLATLTHPNIAAIYGVEESTGAVDECADPEGARTPAGSGAADIVADVPPCSPGSDLWRRLFHH
jgi:hypothetical protein